MKNTQEQTREKKSVFPWQLPLEEQIKHYQAGADEYAEILRTNRYNGKRLTSEEREIARNEYEYCAYQVRKLKWSA